MYQFSIGLNVLFVLLLVVLAVGHFLRSTQSIRFRGNLESVVLENSKRFKSALKSHSPNEVLKLFSSQVTFHPTLSNNFVCTLEGVREYFEHFLVKNPICLYLDSGAECLSEDAYLHTGIYNFEISDEGERKIVHARFSFIWSFENGTWKIVHFHSSLMPTEN